MKGELIMPSGKRIDWSQYDQLLESHLPTMTVANWCREHAPDMSDRAAATRARKIGVKPKKYKPSQEHKDAISIKLRTVDKAMSEEIRAIRDDFSKKEIAEKFGITISSLERALDRYNITLSDKGIARWRKSSREKQLGKEPWNIGLELPEETRKKIGEALKGEKNGQYGRGMTEEEKVRWREAYFKNGIHKMRSWLKSEKGQEATQRGLLSIRTAESRNRASETTSRLILEGKIKTNRGIPTRMSTLKGGNFTTKSSYETRYVDILEDDPDVITFSYEPFRIPYTFDGVDLWYIPDFLVKYAGREELIEVKPAKLLDLPKNVAKIAALERHELPFRVITEGDLGL